MPIAPEEDPNDGAAASTSGVSALSRLAAGRVVTACVGSSSDALGFGTNVTLALLLATPTLDTGTGTWSITGKELDPLVSIGYERLTVARATGFTGPFGGSPVRASNLAPILSTTNTGPGPWSTINAVALIDSDGAVIAWKGLTNPVTVPAGEKARISAGDLLIYVPSV